MAITTTLTFKEWLQADGSKWVEFIFTVNGKEMHYHRRLPGATDSQAVGTSLISSVEGDAAQQEIGEVIAAIDDGKDSLAATQGVVL